MLGYLSPLFPPGLPPRGLATAQYYNIFQEVYSKSAEWYVWTPYNSTARPDIVVVAFLHGGTAMDVQILGDV